MMGSETFAHLMEDVARLMIRTRPKVREKALWERIAIAATIFLAIMFER
ncbi:hypothetical protein ACTQZS_08005 [Bilifractor sp. LCP19S3_H10]